MNKDTETLDQDIVDLGFIAEETKGHGNIPSDVIGLQVQGGLSDD